MLVTPESDIMNNIGSCSFQNLLIIFGRKVILFYLRCRNDNPYLEQGSGEKLFSSQ